MKVRIEKAEIDRLQRLEWTARQAARKLASSYTRREISPRAEFDRLIQQFPDIADRLDPLAGHGYV